MGALLDGFEAARLKRNEEVAEQQRKEVDVADHLKAVSVLLDQDVGFLKEKGFSHDIKARALRLSRTEGPVMIAHYDSATANYTVTHMRDGRHVTNATAAECAQAIGSLIFDEIHGA